MILLNSVASLGVTKTDDFNGEHQKGVGLYQFMNRKEKIISCLCFYRATKK